MRVLWLLDVVRHPALLLMAAVVAACARGSVRGESGDPSNEQEIQSDSARVAALAIAAVSGRADSLFEYRVIQFTTDSLGWVVSVVPQVRAKYADSIVGVGGGGSVRVWRGDSVTVLRWYR